MSYTEFSYMLLQAYDFVHLHDKYGCELQAGGSDQWGNITAGIDLARRMRGVQLYGITWPLLTKSDGTKMGKTESGRRLARRRSGPARTSSINTGSTSTTPTRASACGCSPNCSHEEIEALDAARAADPGKRESQRRLAEELTRLVHGDAGLAAAQRATEIFFGAEISDLSDAQLGEIFADVPSKALAAARLSDGTLNDRRRARRSRPGQEQGRSPPHGRAGRRLRQQPPRRRRSTRKLTAEHLASETVMVLRSGKKKYALLRFV